MTAKKLGSENVIRISSAAQGCLHRQLFLCSRELLMIKRIAYDPSFWLLIAFNGYCIIYYSQNADSFFDIVWLYWGQSVLIGLFNFIDLLTIRQPAAGSFSMNDKQIEKWGNTGCSAFFFLLHYQFFHLVYFLFLFGDSEGKWDMKFILIGLAAVSAELLVNFIRNKIRQRTEAVNVGKMFFLPYLRIVPMHLMILLPTFLGIEASVVFLLLKTIADLAMYLITSKSGAVAAG
jgi:hypothetical protein